MITTQHIARKMLNTQITSILPTGDDKSAVQWIQNNAAITDKLVKQVRLEFASNSVLEALNGLSSDEVKAVLGQLNK